MITPFKKFLFDNEITLSSLSEASGVSITTLSRIANGRVTPKISTAEIIAETLGDKKLVWKLWPNVYRYERIIKHRS